MANQLDLEEQEQLDELKHFWSNYGNFISWFLIIVLGAVAAWNGYQYWQRSQATQAAAMFDEIEKIAREGDVPKAERVLSDMKERFASTVYTQQAALLVAKTAYEAGKTDSAKAALTWVSENASDKAYASIGRLRLSGLLIEAKAYDEALKILSDRIAPEYAPLVADRKGDLLIAQGKKPEAKAEYQKAHDGFEESSEYRRMVAVKLGALGVNTDGTPGKQPAEATK